MTAKIIQIIPAVGWECVYRDEDGQQDAWPVAFFWLDSDGNTGIAEMDMDGIIDYDPVRHDIFVAVQHRDYQVVLGDITRGE